MVTQLVLALTFPCFLIALVVLSIGVLVLTIACAACKPRWDSARKAQLPREITSALANARRTSEACLSMCDAAAIVQTLRAAISQTAENGPTDAELLVKRKAAARECLEYCRCLSVEAVNLTADARYALLRGLFQCAETACGNCQPVPGQEACLALEFLNKISLDT